MKGVVHSANTELTLLSLQSRLRAAPEPGIFPRPVSRRPVAVALNCRQDEPPIFPVPPPSMKSVRYNTKYARSQTHEHFCLRIKGPASATPRAAFERADGHRQYAAALTCIRTIGGMQTKIVSTPFSGGQCGSSCQCAHSAWAHKAEIASYTLA